jgi:hypothetical protein
MSECVPPAFVAVGGHTRRAERGLGGQYFGRRETWDWPLTVMIYVYNCSQPAPRSSWRILSAILHDYFKNLFLY